MEEKNIKSSPREIFIYILTAIALYWSAYDVISLSFSYINIWLPDPLQPFYNAGDAIRWPLASLIILVPVYVWCSRFLMRDIKANPEKADIRARKWILYLTLFLAGVLIIGDMIILVYYFLDGELSSRFLLKVLAVLIVASGVFKYYLSELRNKTGELSRRGRVIAWGGAAIVLAVVVVGFFAAGSPFKQRLVRFDERKISDLQSLQTQIVSYWQNKDKLPSQLNDLADSISGFTPPADPQSGKDYEYRPTGDLAFELCADFNLSSAESQINSGYMLPGVKESDNWKHEAGRGCFSRAIDPQIYSPDKPVTRTPSTLFCGGIAGIACPGGYVCKLDGNYPDAGGECVKTGS